MLSRTADSLFWLVRYVERAENMARLMDMGRRMGGVPGGKGPRSEWPSILAAAGCAGEFYKRHDAATPTAAMRFLMLDRANFSSVVSCFEGARANARSSRGALTREMWEAINDAWIEMRGMDASRLDNGAMSPLLDWIKARCAQFRGAADGSALRRDGYEFQRLGGAVERMDNTARLMDVKYVDPARRAPDGAVDHFQWVAILRAAGLLRAFHAAYHADYEPTLIADFLVRNTECPRSLAHCAERIVDSMTRLERLYGKRETCHDQASELLELLRTTDVEVVFAGDPHAFLTEVIRRNNLVSASIADAYHFSASAAEAPADAPAGAPVSAASPEPEEDRAEDRALAAPAIPG